MRNRSSQPSVGYIGVDILNNATICNETTALLQRDVPLDLVSVYKFSRPTYYQEKSLELLDNRIHHLYPMRLFGTLWQIALAPFVFRRNFFRTIWKALTGKVEGPKQRLKVLGHLLPALKLAHYWRHRSIGHVHCQWAHTATTIGMHAAELLGVGFSFMGHANDLFVHRVALEDKIKRARFTLCISEYHRQFYLDLGADPRRLHVVYCGVSLDRFQTLSAPAPQRPSRRIVSVGRLVEKKGFDVLIRACGELRDRKVDFECVIAGSGPEYRRLQALVESLHLEAHVRITGEAMLQEDMPEFLRSGRLFCLPCVQDSEGDMDGLPQVLIESMACRVPTVATFLVGIPDLVRDGENGLLVEPQDVVSCADAIEEILENEALGAEFGRRAEQWANAHFGREELARRLDDVFSWCLKNPGESAPVTLLAAAPGSAEAYREHRLARQITAD